MQKDITNETLELIRRTSSSLPKDVEDRLRASVEKEEPGSAARGALETIMKNIELSRANATPICQDTGTPIFYVHYPEGWSTRKLKEQIRSALVEATKKSYMRPNAVDAIYDKNSGNNAVGGAAAFLAQTVQKVLEVYKLEEFGVPEALWVIEVKEFPVVVTMDAHGQSKHATLDESSKQVLDELLAKPY